MLSLTRGRVARRLRVLTEIARDKVRRRDNARQDAAALESIREAVTAAGVDPETNPGVRYYGGADRTLARLGDSPEQQQAGPPVIPSLLPHETTTTGCPPQTYPVIPAEPGSTVHPHERRKSGSRPAPAPG
jgi:hypothetical protein